MRRLGVLRSPMLRVLVPVMVIALAVRLTAVLRGGGLYGVVAYDGSVYYTAAVGLTYGLVPYRDFLLLHPPGIVVALLPFAALGRLIGDPDAFALARLTWIALGAVNAALVSWILRRFGAWPALAGGLFYACYVPAIYTERNTALEVVGSTCLLVAVALLTRVRPRDLTPAALLLAGAVLGASSATKIWGVVLALALILWSVAAAGLRRALVLAAGVAGGTILVCLPFFIAAPAMMWRMVVLDQIGRRRVGASLTTRLIDIAGLSEVYDQAGLLLVIGLGLAGVGITVLAATTPLGRLAILLTAVSSILLLAGPSWSVRYAGLAGPPAALLFGSGVAALHQRLHRRRRLAAALVAAGLVGYTVISLPGLSFGRSFPGATLRTALAATPGCITTDDPTVLIETGRLQTNLEAGCPLVADLGGYSYHLQPGASRRSPRSENQQWQEFVRSYLGSGDATVIARFQDDTAFDPSTTRLIARWRVLGRVGIYQVQDPTPAVSPPP